MGQRYIQKVIVVGAGPVGLLTALMLGQKGISVDVLEANNQVNNSPRGLAYGPAAVRVLHRAEILEKTIKKGFIASSVAWRKPDGTLIMGLDRLDIPIEGLPHSVILPVGSLASLLVEEIQNHSSVTIHWNHRVTGVGQDGGNPVFIGYDTPSRFADLKNEQASIDFDKLGLSDAQWIIHPAHWFVVARIDKAGLWRIVYGETPGLSIDEVRSRLTEKFREHLPGNPEPEEYTLHNVTPYSVHQRCAEKMRLGRVLLAGDAAHLNNPMGGLGLTTGVADVGSLIDCLLGIHEGVASYDILDKYDEMRRQIFLTRTDVISTANFKRIMQDSEGVVERDPILQLVEQAKTDPNIAASLAKHELSIGCDMTQIYDTSRENGTALNGGDLATKPSTAGIEP